MSDITDTTTQGTPDAGAEPAGATPDGAQTQAEQPPIDYEQLSDRLWRQMEPQLANAMEQRPQPQAEPEPELDPYAPLEDMYDDPNAVTQLRGVLDPIINSRVESVVSAVRDENAQLRQDIGRLTRDLDLGDLEDRYPALQREEVAQPVLQEARVMAERLGRPEDATHPTIIETAYLARLGRERAASETPADGQNGSQLEQASGATPAEPEPDLAAQIVAARGGPRTPASDFWGWSG